MIFTGRIEERESKRSVELEADNSFFRRIWYGKYGEMLEGIKGSQYTIFVDLISADYILLNYKYIIARPKDPLKPYLALHGLPQCLFVSISDLPRLLSPSVFLFLVLYRFFFLSFLPLFCYKKVSPSFLLSPYESNFLFPDLYPCSYPNPFPCLYPSP